MSELLKPCPFCGHSEAILDQGRHGVLCNYCQSDVPDGWWQRRMPGPATKSMLDFCRNAIKAGWGTLPSNRRLQAFLDEWKGENS